MTAPAVDSLIPNPAAIFAKVVCFAQVQQFHRRAVRRVEFAAPVPLTGDDEHRDTLHERVRRVEYDKIDDQWGLQSSVVETSEISINSSGGSLVACHLVGGQPEEG